MNKNAVSSMLASIVLLVHAPALIAQDVVYVPVDIFTCKYNDGKGPADLDAVTAQFNDYMDDNDATAYAAWTLTKHYASADQDFDFVWLGAHRNGESMGAGADDWETNGGEIMEAFAATATCDTAGNYMSQMFKPPQGGNAPSNGVIQMSDCKLNEGVAWEAHDAALKVWAAVLRDVGSQAGMYSWFPVAGTGEHDVHFKSIYAYPNHLEFGKDYDRLGNGGLWKRAREILWPIASCDVPRLYDARLRRTAQIRE